MPLHDENIEIVELKRVYTFREDENEVVDFLFANTFLIDELYETFEPLKKVFGDAEFVLYMDTYLSNRLILRVYTDDDMNEDERNIFKFDKMWWNKNLHRVKNKLCITA